MGRVVGVIFQNIDVRVFIAFFKAGHGGGLNITKTPREFGLLGLGQVLIAENQDRTVEQGGMNFIELPVGQRGREVQPLDDGATGG